MKLNKIAIAKAQSLIAINWQTPTSDFTIMTRKLSDYYSSRSTNYASCLNSAPFIISRDMATIVAAGYSKACKAVITLELTDEVKAIAEEMRAKRIKDIADQQKAADLQIIKIEATNAEFDSVKDKLLAKWMAHPLSNGKRNISHKEANQLAWKKQNYISTGADIVTYRNLIKTFFNQVIN